MEAFLQRGENTEISSYGIPYFGIDVITTHRIYVFFGAVRFRHPSLFWAYIGSVHNPGHLEIDDLSASVAARGA